MEGVFAEIGGFVDGIGLADRIEDDAALLGDIVDRELNGGGAHAAVLPASADAIAHRAFELADPSYRKILEAYAGGVNSGLSALGAAPFEYLVLRTTPEPWQAEDSILTLLAMFNTLQGRQALFEQSVAELRDALARRSGVRLHYVPGHAGVVLNERADALAREAVRERTTRREVLRVTRPAGAPGT